ncbi:FapA family protein, partial [Candidatus Latescibacterota bacterium]
IIGNVEDAKIVSGSDVIVHGGCAGSGEGYIIAQRDVIVKFVENQHIEAKRDIIINGESFHATLQAGRSLSVKGKKGAIVGGVCEVKASLETDYLGSVACPPTIIKLGVDPKLIEKLNFYDSETEKSEGSLEKIEKSVLFLYRQKVDAPGGILPQEKQALLDKLEVAKKALPDKLEKLNAEKIKLLKEQKELDKVFAIANTAVFPKVQVYIGNQYITIDDNLGPSRFQLIGSEVTRTSK